jgi:hypothetical protein
VMKLLFVEHDRRWKARTIAANAGMGLLVMQYEDHCEYYADPTLGPNEVRQLYFGVING